MSTERPERLLELCADQRTYWAGVEAVNPRLVRKQRSNAAADGWGAPALVDDPIITLRCSDVEAVARDAATLARLVPLLASLPDDGYRDADLDALEQARTIAAEVTP